MKNIIISLVFLSKIFSYNTGYAGIYFNNGLILSGSYTYEKDDDETINGSGIGFSYLFKAKESDFFEFSAFYNNIDSDDLNMKMLSSGIGYYFDNIKLGVHYEWLNDFSGNVINELNYQGFEMDMSASSRMFSVGFYKRYIKENNFVYIPFIDITRVDSDVSTALTLNGTEILNITTDDSTNLIRLGIGFKKNNIVIQPLVTMNDGTNRFTINTFFKFR